MEATQELNGASLVQFEETIKEEDSDIVIETLS